MFLYQFIYFLQKVPPQKMLDKGILPLYDDVNRYLFTAGVPKRLRKTLRTCPGNSDEGKRIRSFRKE